MGKKILAWVLGIFLFLLSLLLFFPNVFNHREIAEFGGINRKSGVYIQKSGTDSVVVTFNNFYNRDALTQYLLGSHHRALWSSSVTLPTFRGTWDSLSFKILEVGGGQQTTSFKLRDNYGRDFTLRSVNKDQAKALSPWLKKTGIRTLFRDQASALHPYGAIIAARLASEAEIPTTRPIMVFVPETNAFAEEFKDQLVNRIMLLEIEINDSWNYREFTGTTNRVISTSRLLEQYEHDSLTIDYQFYAYCRVFDVLIGDWDRHAKQWKWVVDTTTNVARPFPVDRDMALYLFNDGVINRIALNVNNKFQSFEPEFSDVSGYFINGLELDSVLFPNVSDKDWKVIEQRFDKILTKQIIHSSFIITPGSGVPRKLSREADIFLSRLANIHDITSFVSNNYKYHLQALD